MSHRAKSNRPKDCPYVSKGGLKLAFALEHFEIDVQQRIAVDLGSHQGGFVDCLLKHHAHSVYSVDTCYGTLAWSLRQDSRVRVYERTNAIHWVAPELVDLVTIDLGWTRQHHILPNVIRWLKPQGIVLSLLKPQYELPETPKHVLDPHETEAVFHTLLPWLSTLFQKVQFCLSPYLGSGGNTEAWLCLSEKICSTSNP